MAGVTSTPALERAPEDLVAKGGIQSWADFAVCLASRQNWWPRAEFNPGPILRSASHPAKFGGQGRNSILGRFCGLLRIPRNLVAKGGIQSWADFAVCFAS